MYGIVCFFICYNIAPKEALLSLMRGKESDAPYTTHDEYADTNELKMLL